MFKKITLVTLFISCGVISAELVPNDQALAQTVESQNIKAIALEKIALYKCTPFPLCADYPNGSSGGSAKTVVINATSVSR